MLACCPYVPLFAISVIYHSFVSFSEKGLTVHSVLFTLMALLNECECSTVHVGIFKNYRPTKFPCFRNWL